MKITDSAIEEIIGIFLNYFALFAFFAANRNNKGVVQVRCLGLVKPTQWAFSCTAKAAFVSGEAAKPEGLKR